MIRIFQFLSLSNMSYVQDDIIFPLMKWMPHMPVQWCTSFSSVTKDSMATTHPVLQASGNKPHPCIFMASFSKIFSSIHYCSFYFPTAIYFSSNWCITSVQKGSMTLPVTTNRTIRVNKPLLVFEDWGDTWFHRANFIQKFHQIEAHLCLFSSYSVRSMDYNIQHC